MDIEEKHKAFLKSEYEKIMKNLRNTRGDQKICDAALLQVIDLLNRYFEEVVKPEITK